MLVLMLYTIIKINKKLRRNLRGFFFNISKKCIKDPLLFFILLVMYNLYVVKFAETNKRKRQIDELSGTSKYPTRRLFSTSKNNKQTKIVIIATVINLMLNTAFFRFNLPNIDINKPLCRGKLVKA